MKLSDSPVIVGSMFYEGDDLILDAAEGAIDESKVVERIDKTRRLSEEYGIPLTIDLEIPSIKSASNIISLVGKSTDTPLWISSFTEEMRLEACKIALNEGIGDRIYYSTLNYMSNEQEFKAVADMGVKSILQIFNPENPYADGYLSKAEQLLHLAEKAGIKLSEIILLPTVLDFGSIPIALSTIPLLKEKYELPICVPSIGPVYKWAKQYSPNTRRFLLASTLTYTLAANADLIHIGTIKRSFIAFPVFSLINKFEKRKEKFM
jgi:tetrahydromethanopterin S-methyltransferase subunit H